MIDKLFHLFEKTLAAVLLLLIAVVAVLAVVELCMVLYRDLSGLREFLLNERGMFELFGMFLIVLIAIELMASIHMYMKDKSVHAEIMLLIAITALTRKVVVLDADAYDPMYLIGLAALLGTLIGGYYLLRRLGYESRAGQTEQTAAKALKPMPDAAEPARPTGSGERESHGDSPSRASRPGPG